MKESIFDGVKYLYAEQLKGKRVTLTIKKVVGGVEFIDTTGRKNKGFDIHFDKTEKVLGVAGVTVRRQLCATCGTENIDEWPGKKITLYPVPSKKAATGFAIRIDPQPQGSAQLSEPAQTGESLEDEARRKEAVEAAP